MSPLDMQGYPGDAAGAETALRVIAGRYELRDRIGRGACGEVFEAFDRRLGRLVAVKTMPVGPLADADATQDLRRFQQEAQMVSRLSHPNIVTVHDFGRESDQAWIVMELVIGETLTAVLARGERVPLAEAIRVTCALLDALHYAHGRGIVHRDVKPANILLAVGLEDGLGEVRLADFGISRLGDGDATVVGDLIGTPAVMAPEQLRGEPVDRRTDLWAVGVILYELLTGRRPFGGAIPAIFHHIQTQEPPAPSSLVPGLPAGFDEVIATALAKRAADRFADAAAMAAAIQALAEPVGATIGWSGAVPPLPGLDLPVEPEPEGVPGVPPAPPAAVAAPAVRRGIGTERLRWGLARGRGLALGLVLGTGCGALAATAWTDAAGPDALRPALESDLHPAKPPARPAVPGPKALEPGRPGAPADATAATPAPAGAMVPPPALPAGEPLATPAGPAAVAPLADATPEAGAPQVPAAGLPGAGPMAAVAPAGRTESPPVAAAMPPAAPPLAACTGQQAMIETGTHRGFGRIVFGWRSPPVVGIRLVADGAILQLAGPGCLPVPDRVALPRNLLGISLAGDTLRIQTAPGTILRQARWPGHILLDVLDPPGG